MKQRDSLYQRKPGGPFYAIVVWKGQRYAESTGFTTRTDAKARLAEIRNQVLKGTYRTPTERRADTVRATTVAKLSERWLSIYVAVNRNEKGQALSKYRAETYLVPFMGKELAANVSKDTLRQYRAHLEALTETVTDEKGKETEAPRLTAQTVAHILSDARALFTWAFDSGHIGTLPVPRKLLPTIPETEPRGLSKAEQVTVANLDGPLGLGCRIMLGTGVRWSELCRLTSADVKGGELVVQGETKSKKMRRIPVPPALLSELKGHVGKLVPYGQLENPTFCRTVQRRTEILDFSAHRLRHSFALNYLEAGGNIRVLQALLGHASLETTEIYMRISQETTREDARKVMGWSATA